MGFGGLLLYAVGRIVGELEPTPIALLPAELLLLPDPALAPIT